MTPLDALAHELALEWARDYVKRWCVANEHGWIAVNSSVMRVRELRFLDLSGHLIRHPDNPNLVRIKE